MENIGGCTPNVTLHKANANNNSKKISVNNFRISIAHNNNKITFSLNIFYCKLITKNVTS